jgi:DNA-binding winged helix-turn-helix (wHTH) protein
MMIYSFGDIELDRNRFEVRRAGKVLPVEPKVFDLLVCLVDNRHRVVTKAELLTTVWGGRAVVDSVVPRAVCLARKAVGERRIRTRHGRGYFFVDSGEASIVSASSTFASIE